MLLLHFPRLHEIVGGREIRSYETARALASMGARVVVLALDRGPLTSMVDGVPVVRPRRLLGPLAFILAPLLAVLLAMVMARGRGIVYVPYPPGLSSRLLDVHALIILSLAASLGLVRLWVNMHDPLLEQLLYSSKAKTPGIADRLLHHALSLAAPRAWIATAASEAMARMLSSMGARAGVYYAGVNPLIVDMTPPPAEWRGRIGYTGSPGDDDLNLLLDHATKAEEECGPLETIILTRSRDPLPPGARRVPARYASFPWAARQVDLFVLPRRRNPLFEGTLPNKLPMFLASKRPVAVTLTTEIEWYLTRYLEPLCGPPRHAHTAEPESLWKAIVGGCKEKYVEEAAQYAECMREKASWRRNLERAICQALAA